MVPDELPESTLFSALEGAALVYFDVWLHDTASVIAKEATRRKIPILVDAERRRDGLDDLLNLATYVVCSEKFPQAWTSAPSIPSALVSMLLRMPKLKFIVLTLGEKGCIMLERSKNAKASATDVTEVEPLLESLRKEVDKKSVVPKCIASKSNLRLGADGIGAVTGRLLLGTAELFVQACPQRKWKMLPFASQVAAAGCRALGARSGLPWRTDHRLAPFW